ncbi:MAG: hypothetical protein LBP21_00025 [Synergistaceae bacterium]|jgi:hypothetical protein|nr:hypothetical protein [Synergistaceae bacterium]
MEQNITEQLVEFLRNKKADFIKLTDFKKEVTEPLRTQFKINSKSTVSTIQQSLEPHLGDILVFLKKGGAVSLSFKPKPPEPPKPPDPPEVLLFRIIQNQPGETPGTIIKKASPLKKEACLDVLNSLLEQGRVRALKLNNKYVPVLYPGTLSKVIEVSEEAFREAFQKLEQGNFYVRICDMRRHLAWPKQEFDTVLKSLRDEGKIQLQVGAIDLFNEQDIQDSFVDENGFRMLTLRWKQ